MTREEAIDKVRKLLRLGTSSCPEEAAAAIAAAQRIMDRYSIEADKIAEERDDTSDGLAADFKITNDTYVEIGRRPRAWVRSLLLTIANANGCIVYRDAIRTRAVFCGRMVDAQACVYMWSFVVGEMERMRAKLPRGMGTRFYESWRLGFTHGVRDAIDQMRARANSETSLVAIKDSLAKRRRDAMAFLRERIHLASGRRSSYQPEANGYAHGVRDGRSVRVGDAAMEPGRRKALGD